MPRKLPGLGRRHRASMACALAALLFAVSAVIDHRNEQARSNGAELREWYCGHDGTRCGGPSSAAIERDWESRELGYEVAAALCVAAAGGLAVRHLWRRDGVIR